MLSWFKTKTPRLSETNPGKSFSIRTSFARGELTWTEEVDLVTCLAGVLKSLGYRFRTHDEWLQLECGIILQPRFVHLQPVEPTGVKTTSTVEASHPFAFPDGLFEYQFSQGKDLTNSFRQGFEGWAEFDLPVLLDLLRMTPKNCTHLTANYPLAGSTNSLERRVIFGPPGEIVANRVTPEQEDEHPFCPCCLFTNSIDSFKKFLETDAPYGIRLLAARYESGNSEADCRVNGSDWQEGQNALMRYIETWPQRGFELRKQYVVIQTVPKKDFAV